jgi:hypothetical protein
MKRVLFFLNLLKALKKLIFGTSTGILNDEWMSQGFSFCDYPKLKYGLVQKRMGPCGLFASLQAYFLIELLFENGVSNPNTTLYSASQSGSVVFFQLSDLFPFFMF